MKKGKIIKSIAGFYEVHTGENIYRCRARGVFRALGVKPLVGDDVEIVTPLYSCVQERFGHDLTLRGSWPIRLRDQVMNVDVYRGERAGVPVWFISQRMGPGAV